MQPLAFPRRINVEVTNHCDQRCVLCPRQGFTRALGFMAPELFARLAHECAGKPTALWLHFLGEPLLHPRLPEMVRAAKEAGVRQVGVSTNGVSLDERAADALIDAGLDRLECSMDADDREAYAAMRGRDHFERVLANVRAFFARKRARDAVGPVTSVQFMRTAAVEARLAEIVEQWRPLLGPDDFVMTIVPSSFGGASQSHAGSCAGASAALRPPCTWLYEALVVLQDGTVTMCGTDWDAHAPLGSLENATIEQIWSGAEMQRRRRAHESGRFDGIGPCAACNDWRLADGHGYVNALAEVDRRRAESERAAR